MMNEQPVDALFEIEKLQNEINNKKRDIEDLKKQMEWWQEKLAEEQTQVGEE